MNNQRDDYCPPRMIAQEARQGSFAAPVDKETAQTLTCMVDAYTHTPAGYG
jgi:hypothetical protein